MARIVTGHTGVVTGPRQILHVDMDAFFVSVELRRRPGSRRPAGRRRRNRATVAWSPQRRTRPADSACTRRCRQRWPAVAVRTPCSSRVTTALYGEVSAAGPRDPRSLHAAGRTAVARRGIPRRHRLAPAVRSGTGRSPRRSGAPSRDELALGCSVGVAPNKFLAKLASVEAKPRATPSAVEPGPGVVVVVAGGEREFLDPLPVQRLWGVGPVTLDKLHRIGIRRVADLAAVDDSALGAALGRRPGRPPAGAGARDRRSAGRTGTRGASRSATRRRTRPTSTTADGDAHASRAAGRRRGVPAAQGRCRRRAP